MFLEVTDEKGNKGSDLVKRFRPETRADLLIEPSPFRLKRMVMANVAAV